MHHMRSGICVQCCLFLAHVPWVQHVFVTLDLELFQPDSEINSESEYQGSVSGE